MIPNRQETTKDTHKMTRYRWKNDQTDRKLLQTT